MPTALRFPNIHRSPGDTPGSGRERGFLELLDLYVHSFKSGQLHIAPDGLCGRVLRGMNEDDFKTLSPDADRRTVFLAGSDVLSQSCGKGLTEILKIVGYSEADIEAKVHREKNEFRLLVTPESDTLRPATWVNVVELAERLYPELQGRLVQHLEAFQQMPFQEIDRLSAFSIAEVASNGQTDPRYMTVERFLASRCGLHEARALLYHTLQLRELFRGDGYTQFPDGTIGGTEYIVPNMPLTLLDDYRLIPLRD